ncbi:MAG TPA: hypothetical protein VFK85_00845 [Anaeromyxobacteraceae bacterium]|nr:hypothetical protein [Anaeromyxobacteraceae bacterium]
MTTELQHAMARYEEARIAYRKAVLASLNGESNGDAIRDAIKAFQVARAELKLVGGESAEAPAPAAAPAPARREESIGDSLEEIGTAALSFFRGLLQAG